MMPRVLVVDDDSLYAEAATAILRQDDRLDVVGRACDGREAVQLAQSLRPDVVLMDIEMPVMDGIEATRSLRRLLPSARVVVVTSSASEADRRGGPRGGAPPKHNK
jgi:DNA-binding NarL/FixJ family response regulator